MILNKIVYVFLKPELYLRNNVGGGGNIADIKQLAFKPTNIDSFFISEIKFDIVVGNYHSFYFF